MMYTKCTRENALNSNVAKAKTIDLKKTLFVNQIDKLCRLLVSVAYMILFLFGFCT